MGASEGDSLNKKLGFTSNINSVDNPQSIVTKHESGFVSSFGPGVKKVKKVPFESPFSGLDKITDKYTENPIQSIQIGNNFSDERTSAGSFYPSKITNGNSSATSDTHTIAPMLAGTTLTDAGYEQFNDGANLVESEQNGMPFYFKDLRDNKYVIFRAYLSSITEDLNPTWNSTNYIGRSEPVYLYSSTERSISFTFKVFAGSKNELDSIYEKINELTKMVYPQYKKDKNLGNKNRMRPPYVSLRMGELFGNSSSNLTGWIRSINYSWPETSPWEIEEGKRVPKQCDITIGYQVVHRDPPSYDTPANEIHGYKVG